MAEGVPSDFDRTVPEERGIRPSERINVIGTVRFRSNSWGAREHAEVWEPSDFDRTVPEGGARRAREAG